jgi:transketolase
VSITGREVKQIVLRQSKLANVGHVGSALSIADIIAVLYDRVLRVPSPADPDRDRFILSKGHAALALYAALHLRGWVTREQLDSYCQDDSLLGVHPEHDLTGIDFSTGSLGQGLSVGLGAALAAKKQGSARRVFVMLSDAECNEGSVWESAALAAHQGADNLTAIIDLNGQQALGLTADVLRMNQVDKWSSFGWSAVEVNGHDARQLEEELLRESDGRPRVIIAKTIFGGGVSFMKGQIKWHYLPLQDEDYERALSDIEAGS